MQDWIKNAGNVTALGVTGLGVAVGAVVVAFVLVALTSIFLGDVRRTAAMQVLDRLLLLVATLRGGVVKSPSASPPSAAGGDP